MNYVLHMNDWESAWKVIVIVLGFGLIVGKLTERPRIPDVAAYLLLGIALGPAVLHLMYEPTRSQVTQFVFNIGAVLILFDGGRGVTFAVLRRVFISITLLATIGVILTAGVVGLTAHLAFHTSWPVSLLLGSVIASTDPATLIPVFKRVPILSRLQQTVESESAFNDATGAVLVFTLVGSIATGTSIKVLPSIGTFLHSAVFGLGIGFVVGLLALWLVSQSGWGVLHEYGSLAMLVLALLTYQLADMFHASGYMAAFAAGVISGNGKSFGWPLAPHTEANVHHFGNAITMIMRMMIFVLLGTQVDFRVVGANLWPALLVVAVLIFLARPITVLSSVLVDRRARWSLKEVLFMFWVRETGVIPAALSAMVAAEQVPGWQLIGAVTLIAILVTILLQASTTGFVAKRLGVLVTAEDEEI